ncbi:MAG TPA: EamA family transporter [Actinomycetota bacterium]|nr:EamA family transporter [Actinomycetota bacterium]
MNVDGVARNALLTALAPAVWGSTYIVTTEWLPPDRPLLAATMRSLPPGLILLGLGRKLPSGTWWWRALALGVLNIGAFFYLLFVAAYHLPGGVAALVGSIQPTVVLVLSAVILKQAVRATHVVSCVVGVVGIGLLVLRPDAALDGVGVLAGLGGAASMATGIVLTKLWGRPEGVGILTFTGWQLGVGGVVLLPVMLAAEGLPGVLTGTNVAGYLYLGGIGALVAYSIWFRGIGRLPALAVSCLGFVSPLVATALGYVVLGQELTPLQVAGAGAVFAAVVLAQPAGGRRHHPPPASEPVGQEPVAATRAGLTA